MSSIVQRSLLTPFVPECISFCEIGHLLGAVRTFCSGHTPSVGISRHLWGYKSYCSWLYSVPDTDHLHPGGGGTSPHRLTKLRLLYGTNSPDSDLSTPLSWYGSPRFHAINVRVQKIVGTFISWGFGFSVCLFVYYILKIWKKIRMAPLLLLPFSLSDGLRSQEMWSVQCQKDSRAGLSST